MGLFANCLYSNSIGGLIRVHHIKFENEKTFDVFFPTHVNIGNDNYEF